MGDLSVDIAQYQKTAPILDLGCGCGWNLLWLASRGFSSLYGADISESALDAMSEFEEIIGTRIEKRRMDFYSERYEDIKFDVIFTLSAARLDPRYEIRRFLKQVSSYLNPRGYVILDVIDSAYNNMPNNQYHTADWNKPPDERRPTEHPVRNSTEEVSASAKAASFETVHHIFKPFDRLCLKIYIMRKAL